MTDLTETLAPAALPPGSAPDAEEERIWMESQQAPETLRPGCLAVALPQAPRLGPLLARIEELADQLPDLAQAYRFGEDCLLRKEPAPLPLAEIRSLAAAEDAPAVLAAALEEPWDLGARPPFRALLLAAPDGALLGLLRHPVLGTRAGFPAILRGIAGEAPDGAPAAPAPETPLVATLPAGGRLADTLAALARHLEDGTPMEGLAPLAPAAGDAPQEGPETAILAEFRSALNAPDMGPEDDFFDFGGHSLVATRVIGLLQSRHGLEVRFADFFRHATARGLAAHVVGTAPAPATSVPAPAAEENGEAHPLSLAQQSLWRAYSRFGKGAIFNIPFALRFLDPVEEDVFGQAFRDLLVRHPVLRSHFREEDGRAVQVPVAPAALDSYRWFWTTAESDGATRAEEAEHVFDLARELPLRLRFLPEEDGTQLLSMLFHHVVVDEWSLNQMMEELAHAYACRSRGEAPQWETSPPPFHVFAAGQSEAGVTREHLPFWTSMLEGAGLAQPLFGDAPGPAASPAGGWVEIRLDPAESDGLARLARAGDASLFNAAYAAIAAMQHRLAGITDAVIGTSASGRTDPAYFDTVGYFTTVVAHRVEMAPDMTVGALIGQVRDTIAASLPHGGVPIDWVGAALHGGECPPVDQLFESFIQIHAQNRLNGVLSAPDGSGIRFRQVDPEKAESLLGLQFEVMEDVIEGARGIRVLMSYRADRYSPARVEELRQATGRILRQFAGEGSAEMRLSDLAV
ncbi:condensation domain-containing protein [Poseidonocella sp. HB161398]|uniref:condensation domain-containing protein n=1 Tax=Poseidonocella sp. HB161398 TaxID=2320855 RepID=UPI001107FDE3|nr:condensation domain-containing protein [Poseidonocella sp. HB161398]